MNSQAPLIDQLEQVRTLANRNGYYDAADFLKMIIERNVMVKPKDVKSLEK